MYYKSERLKAGRTLKVDYHMHTKCSDGVLTVEQVIERALAESIEALAITDHDTVDGVARARALCGGKAVFCSGLEYTVGEKKFFGLDRPISIHLLGYEVRDEDKALNERLDIRRRDAEACFKRLCGELGYRGMPVVYGEIPISCGIVMQLCDVEAYIAKKYPQAPGLAQAVELIGEYSEYLTKENLTLEEAVDLTHKAGGVAVWAHPFCVYHKFQRMELSREEVSLVMDVLSDAGIDGIEADYLAFGEEDRRWLRKEAKKRQLFCTGGSDFHGSKSRNHMGIQISEILFSK